MKIIGTYVVILAICLLLSFGVTALIVKGVCWAFGFVFTWKLAFGIWLVIALVSSAVKSNVSVKR